MPAYGRDREFVGLLGCRPSNLGEFHVEALSTVSCLAKPRTGSPGQFRSFDRSVNRQNNDRFPSTAALVLHFNLETANSLTHSVRQLTG